VLKKKKKKMFQKSRLPSPTYMSLLVICGFLAGKKKASSNGKRSVEHLIFATMIIVNGLVALDERRRLRRMVHSFIHYYLTTKNHNAS